MKMKTEDLKGFLDEKVFLYNNPKFVEQDPIQIPHMYSVKEDIEIAGFLTAIISWGNRMSIMKSANRMMTFMGNSPFDFVMNHRAIHIERFNGVVHRTFNSMDFAYFIKALRHLYLHEDGLEGVFNRYQKATTLQPAIHILKKEFFSQPHETRTLKHLPDPLKGSAAKKINMYLRWMIRNDDKGVDFGLWEDVSPSKLSCPLDVHSGNVARKLGLLKRKQSDSKAVDELDSVLRSFDPNDPVKYDFALFGLGVFEKF